MDADFRRFNPASAKKNIAVEFSEKLAVIRFIKPAIKNPLSIQTLEELAETLDSLISNPHIETIIFTGSGDTFAAGANLKEIAELTSETAWEFGLRGQNLMRKIADAAQTTVAAVNGFCFGGALDLALACDNRIASPYALFCHPGVNLGIITGWGGTQRLPRLVGEAKALEMFLTAKRVDAAEALQIGLINEIAENPLEYSIANYRAA